MERLAFTTRTAGAMIYLVLFGSILGYSAYVYALKYLPVSTVSLYAYVNPIIAVILGTLILAEPFSLRIVVASALVFAGIAVVRWSPSRRGTGQNRRGVRRDQIAAARDFSPAGPCRSPGRAACASR